MSFKKLVRDNYQEKTEETEKHTFDSRADEILNYVKEQLLSKSKSGTIKEKGKLIKRKSVETLVRFEISDSNKQYIPRYFCYDGRPDYDRWYCKNRVAAETLAMKVGLKCRSEGINISRLIVEPGKCYDGFTLRFWISI